ncbi:MAG: UvrD-helicase domain-containing protein [Candidatus Melainabacteria bacterium]|jgi:F-box protein 18 (helicase)
MKLTPEQKAIINSKGNIKINAVAGSGKTTTIIEYAKSRPRNAKILYLAFNRSVRLEAIKRFSEQGLNNVSVETAHSLAYKQIVYQNDYQVRPQGYKTHEIVEIMGLKGNGEKHTEYIVANHINKCISYYCNSDKQKVQDLNYLDLITDSKAKAFVRPIQEYIIQQTRLFLHKMNKGEIEIIHDFYLKKFQLANPKLTFDYILFDEAQDASPAMLDIFLKQNATKVIVGDTHQQIYGWRMAVNSLEKTDFKTYNLSTSFRFSQDIANLATKILDWKHIITEHETVIIAGKNNTKTDKIKTKAILARTNLGLLLRTIEYITQNKNAKKIYFEGNINSYTYADDGTSLYDVLNLYTGKRKLIRDKLLKGMRDTTELDEYINKTEDVQLGMMVEIIKEYGDSIPGIIKMIKEKHIDDNDKNKAEIIFSTVHRCKGMEYDSIELVNDFMTKERLEKIKADPKEKFDISKLSEEINLLYVAITRTKDTIYIPESLLPIGFPSSSQIHGLKVAKKEKSNNDSNLSNKKTFDTQDKKEKPVRVIGRKRNHTLDEKRETKADAYKPWTEEQDQLLKRMCCENVELRKIALHFGRTQGSISARLKKLDLENIYG